MKKILLAIILLFAVMQFACSKNDAGNGNNNGSIHDDPATGQSSISSEKQTPNLPDINFNNVDFTVLLTGNWASERIQFPYIVSNELSGEIVNDAVYMRNIMIGNKYGVNIKQTDATGVDSWGARTGNGYQIISANVFSGDTVYDAALIATFDACSLARDGYLRDLLDVPYIDHDKPWWDPNIKRDLMINNKIYFTNGDISILNSVLTTCILFNKNLIQEYNLEIPYDFVRNNKWTFDNFFEMAKSISKDLNGDGVMDANDQYGLVIWQDVVYTIYTGAGQKIANVVGGNIELSLYNEITVTAMNKYINFLKSEINVSVHNSYVNKSSHEKMFEENQALMLTPATFYSVKNLRNMEIDFGILPFPKLDETQKDYFTHTHAYGNSFICIPLIVDNVEMSGIILEALAAESMYSVTPAYYDVTLTGKFFRDNESKDMLDILFSTRTYDVGLAYQFGGYTQSLLTLINELRSEFTSMYETAERQAHSEIEAINKAFRENN